MAGWDNGLKTNYAGANALQMAAEASALQTLAQGVPAQQEHVEALLKDLRVYAEQLRERAAGLAMRIAGPVVVGPCTAASKLAELAAPSLVGELHEIRSGLRDAIAEAERALSAF